MPTMLELPVLLRLIDERGSAFRAAVAALPDLDVPVPSCPGWTARDLVGHLGRVHRGWSDIVDAGPAGGPPDASSAPDQAHASLGRDSLLAWSAESTARLLSALQLAGPDRTCWTWWVGSQSPNTSGGIARHQLLEVAVHTYDAQVTAGLPQPPPEAVALDGVEEFLFSCCSGTVAWPHQPASVDYHATEGRSWRLTLTAEGSRVIRIPTPVPDRTDDADASLRATAGDLVLALYGRVPLDVLEVAGDRRILDLLGEWDPDG